MEHLRRATDIKEGDLVDIAHHKCVRVIRIQFGHAVVDLGGRFMQFKLECLKKCDEDHGNDIEDDIV